MNKKPIQPTVKPWPTCGHNCSLLRQGLCGVCRREKVIDKKIEEWHNSDSTLALHEYLGLTEEQYGLWLKKKDNH